MPNEIILYGAEETGISAILTACSMIVLVFMLLLKVASVSSMGKLYEYYHIFTTLTLSIIMYFLVFVGQLINQTVTFNVYLLLSTGLFSTIVVLTIAEVFVMMGDKIIKGVKPRNTIDRTRKRT